MIEYCKGNIIVGTKTVYIRIYIELDKIRGDYVPGVGPVPNTDKIANMAMRQSNLFNNAFPSIDECFFNYDDIHVYSDDAYDYETLDDMNKQVGVNPSSIWNKLHIPLYKTVVDVEYYDGNIYKSQIELYRDI